MKLLAYLTKADFSVAMSISQLMALMLGSHLKRPLIAQECCASLFSVSEPEFGPDTEPNAEV